MRPKSCQIRTGGGGRRRCRIDRRTHTSTGYTISCHADDLVMMIFGYWGEDWGGPKYGETKIMGAFHLLSGPAQLHNWATTRGQSLTEADGRHSCNDLTGLPWVPRGVMAYNYPILDALLRHFFNTCASHSVRPTDRPSLGWSTSCLVLLFVSLLRDL